MSTRGGVTDAVEIALLSMFMVQGGLIATATLYYLAVRKILREKRPVWLMGVSYLIAVFALALSVARHANNDTELGWWTVPLVVAALSGLFTSYIIVRFEVAELNMLRLSDRADMTRQVEAIRARVRGIGVQGARKYGPGR